MAVIRNLVVKIAADISSLFKGLATEQKKLKNISSSFTIGTKMTASLTLPIVALGASVVNLSQQFALCAVVIPILIHNRKKSARIDNVDDPYNR